MRYGGVTQTKWLLLRLLAMLPPPLIIEKVSKKRSLYRRMKVKVFGSSAVAADVRANGSASK